MSQGYSSSSWQPGSLYSGHQASSVLAARVNAKRQELENLKELSSASNGLAKQMEELEKKLSTLNDGAQAVACIMSNWDDILKTITMASSKAASETPKDAQKGSSSTPASDKNKNKLPKQLIRIEAVDE